jgi:hypothetical protein
MKKTLFLAVVGVAIALSAAGPSAQAVPTGRPNFSGTWTLVSGTSAVPGPLGAQGAIAQDQATLTFTTGNHSLRYRLDGSESRSDITTPYWQTLTRVSQARWVTNAVLITTATSAGTKGAWQDLVICSLDQVGNLNIVTVGTGLRASTVDLSVDPWTATKLLVYKRN